MLAPQQARRGRSPRRAGRMSSEMARKAEAGKPAWRYERRCPERTLLYQLVAEHYPRFIELLATQGRSLPEYVQREFEVAPARPASATLVRPFTPDFVKCGILEHGFLRIRCQDCRSTRLAALVPKPRVNLTRFHGVFAHKVACANRSRRSGRGNRPPSGQDLRPARRRHDVGRASQAGIQDRHRNVWSVRRPGQGHCLHRGPAVVNWILNHLEQRCESDRMRGHRGFGYPQWPRSRMDLDDR